MSFPDWKRVVTCIACLGMLVPNTLATETAKPSLGTDVRLSQGGVLHGTIVDEQGRIRTGVPVRVRFNGLTIAQVKTNEAGRFAVSGLRTGTHEVVAPGSKQTARLWSNKTAPASAKTAVVVSAPKVVRGQEDVYYEEPYFDASGALVGGIAVVGAIVGIAAWSDSRSSGPSSP
ncbi:MAG: carboxypeptidase-like regulatory domain-containing protein [Planctomycetaceae bacterium]